MPLQLAPTSDLSGLYQQLDSAYGHQAWWPAKERFEILVGAVLVQNTAWINVEPAIENLRQRNWLEAKSLLLAGEPALHEAIRSSGSFRVKTGRLLNLCRWFTGSGGFQRLDKQDTTALRESLLTVKGIGPETADAILLYAFKRPVFVVDTYTRRVLSRLGWLPGRASYEELRAVFELTLPADSDLFGQYHALFVEHAKRNCRTRPLCKDCLLNEQCEMALRKTHDRTD